MLKFFLSNYEAHWQQHFKGHSTVGNFMGFTKHHETKINKDALKITTRAKKCDPTLQRTSHQNRLYLFHLLLYASFSLKRTKSLNLTQYLLTYWIVLATVYLHFYLLIFISILWILKFIQCLYTFIWNNSKVLMRFNVLFVRFSSWECSYVLFSMKNFYRLTWNCC